MQGGLTYIIGLSANFFEMNFFKLLKISVFIPFFVNPAKIATFMILGIFRLREWTDIFNQIEIFKATNRVSFWRTLYFNYKSLPHRQAKIFPIHIYTKTQIVSSSGCISIEDCEVMFGMIKWGWFNTYRSQGKSRIQNRGHIVFKGAGKILQGCEIVVFPKGNLTICDSFFIGENVLIYCQESIYMSECVRVSYQSDISDSDFHYCVDMESGRIKKKSCSIVIGAYNWIGNRTTIKKGTKTPHHTMVASSGCVLSKDYTNFVKPFSILGGCPARIIKTGISRVWHDEFTQIARFDKELKNKEFFDLTSDEIKILSEL